MSKQRNISGGPLDVPMIDRQVAAGEIVDLPDFQPAHDPASVEGDADYLAIVWPPDKWEPVAEPEPEAKPPEKPKRASRAPAGG